MRAWLIVTLLAAAPASAQEEPNEWTLLFYGAADNSCEETIMDDLAEMKAGLAEEAGVELIVLIDRAPGYSADSRALGEDFVDTRLYRIGAGRVERMDGGALFPELTADSQEDLNVGDAYTVARFIRYGKRYHPAKHYALIFYSHGDGRAMCADDRSGGDELFPGELSAALTQDDSVDLLGFDVCSMGGLELAYQWRPGNGGFAARAMVASGSVSGPWPYDRILRRLRAGDGGDDPAPGATAVLDPAAMSPTDFGTLIVQEIRNDRGGDALAVESWACLDLTRAAAAKEAVDALARSLAAADAKDEAEAVRGEGDHPATLHYMMPGEAGAWRMPYFDLYDLARRLQKGDLPQPVRDAAGRLAEAADALVVSSFGLHGLKGFEDGRHGAYVVFPDGDKRELMRGRSWSAFGWYSPLDARGPRSHGSLAFCRDGATPGNGVVENWFELLDAWFDEGADGGSNGYRW